MLGFKRQRLQYDHIWYSVKLHTGLCDPDVFFLFVFLGAFFWSGRHQQLVAKIERIYVYMYVSIYFAQIDLSSSLYVKLTVFKFVCLAASNLPPLPL